MEVNFNPGTDELILHYDSETRNLLRRIAEPVRKFLEGDIVATQCEPAQRNDLQQGWRVLEQLTADISAHITASGANLALELVALSSHFVARDSSSAESFSRAILFLAAVAPAPLLPLPLPPAAEVFKRKVVPPEIRGIYENLLPGKGPYPPHLTTRQMYDLWLHLAPLRRPSEAVETLVSLLDAYTLFFRATITKMGATDLTDSSQTGAAS